MPAQVKIELSNDDEEKLQANLRGRKTSIRLRERSQIVLFAANGKPNYKIAKELGVGINTVSRWRNRFAENGYKAITQDLPRGSNHGGKNT